jgi:hypothetical protein
MNLQDLLIEQRGPGRGGATVNPVVKPKKDKIVKPKDNTPTTSTGTTPTVDPKIKELQSYLINIEFLSPNKERIKISLNNNLYNTVLNNHEAWKGPNPDITLLQSLIYTIVNDSGYNVSSFNAPESYKEQLDKLISENIVERVKGLKNVLLEQYKKVSYVVKNGKIQKPSSQTTEQPSTAGQPTGPLVPPKTSAVPTPEPEPKPDEGEKTTMTTTTQTLSNNANIKKIKYFSDRILTSETPSYKKCDALFDSYEDNVKLLRKQIEQGLIEPPTGNEPELVDIKKKLKWCYTSSEGKLRFRVKFLQLSSMRDDKIKDESGKKIDNPFKVNI